MATEPEVDRAAERRVTDQGGNPPGQGPFIKVTLAVAGGPSRDAVAERVGPLERHRQVCYGRAALALAEALDQLRMTLEPRKLSMFPRNKRGEEPLM
jgi:hypothetical protein